MADIKVYSHLDSIEPKTSIVITFYNKVANATIVDEVVDLIREGVKKAIHEDAEFRQKVKDSIDHATATMPLEVLAKTVKDVIREISDEKETGNADQKVR